jgi:hypothetical protein
MTPTTRAFETRVRGAFIFGLFCFAAAPVWAQSKVVQIEEHWELRISHPEEDRSAPQTTMVMSPIPHLAWIHFLFTLNHVTDPSFEAGGLQVQLWDGDTVIQENVSTEIGALSHDDEVIRWTQRLTLADDTLTFAIVDGESETWGDFGGSDLTISTPTSLDRLNWYLPSISLTESQVSYAENRVASLVLTKLVWVKDDGHIYEQNAPIPLDISLDDDE